MKKLKKTEPQFLNKNVQFFDPSRGFWRLGFCYKEDSKWVSVRAGKKKRGRKIPNSPEFIRFYVETNKPTKANDKSI